MRKILFLGALCLLVQGCHTRYDMVLSNRTRIEGITKPVLDKETGMYTFKDFNGQVHSVPALRVSVIEPHDRSQEGKSDLMIRPSR